MTDLKMEHGLIDVGGILTETYVRNSLASEEAKEALGLDPDSDYKASVGTAFIEEYVAMAAINIDEDDLAVFDLSPFNQDMRIDSLYIENAQQDQIEITVWTQDGEPLMVQKFQRNKTPVAFPTAPLPPTTYVTVKALTDISYIQLVFVPCQVIARGIAQNMSQSQFDAMFNPPTPT